MVAHSHAIATITTFQEKKWSMQTASSKLAVKPVGLSLGNLFRSGKYERVSSSKLWPGMQFQSPPNRMAEHFSSVITSPTFETSCSTLGRAHLLFKGLRCKLPIHTLPDGPSRKTKVAMWQWVLLSSSASRTTDRKCIGHFRFKSSLTRTHVPGTCNPSSCRT